MRTKNEHRGMVAKGRICVEADGARKTFYIVQSFSSDGCGIRMDPPLEATSENSARRTAARLAARKPSVICFKRTGNPSTGDFDEPEVLISYGSVIGSDDDLPF
jgi:hypothetical protein